MHPERTNTVCTCSFDGVWLSFMDFLKVRRGRQTLRKSAQIGGIFGRFGNVDKVFKELPACRLYICPEKL